MILERLKEERIVTFKIVEGTDGIDRLRVRERCDRYFAEYLTKADAEAMISELQQLVSRMI